MSTFAGGGGGVLSGYLNGAGTVAKFYRPYALCGDSAGNLWIADTLNHMIRKINTAGRRHLYEQ